MTKKDTLLISLFRDKNTKYVFPHFLIRADGRTDTHQTKERKLTTKHNATGRKRNKT